MSGPLDQARDSIYSGPIGAVSSGQFHRSYSHNCSKKSAILRILRRAISKTLTRGSIQNSIVAPIKGALSLKEQDWVINSNNNTEKQNELTVSSEGSLDDGSSMESQNLQWAQGKAGEDRVHVVVSEEHGWVFVGIYDGFNGPDAPDYLLSNLYSYVYKELKGVLWDDKLDSSSNSGSSVLSENPNSDSDFLRADDDVAGDQVIDGCARCIEEENYPIGNINCELNSRKKRCKGTRSRSEIKRRWKCEWDRERLELDRRLKEQLKKTGSKSGLVNHSDVLKALTQALGKTEESYLDVADQMLDENPELALMGSCVLVMLMKGEDVYVMNVGDSRAVLAQKSEPDVWKKDLERIKEETMLDLEGFDDDDGDNVMPSLCASQLTVDHSTSMEEEVQRIKGEHPDDACAVMNDRVKGSLKVTRAFGAGFLKQPKWNDALLEMFRIDYVGTSPYITCSPFLYHHRLGPRDRFLILSSDGLYQYFTNEEAVSEVELFIALWPEGDPAQHLIEEVLFRAAKRAGLDFHELLEIPQGDRRRYHDDVSIIVISLEGRIWRSCV